MKSKSCLAQIILFVILVVALALSIRRFFGPAAPETDTAPAAGTALLGALRAKVAPPEPTPVAEAITLAAAQAPALQGEMFTVDLDGLVFRVSRPLMFPLPQARGLAVVEEFLYIATYDADQRVGFVYQVDRERFAIVQQRAINEDGRTRVGGLHHGARWLWVPVAGDDGQSSVILGLDPLNLEPRLRLAVNDQIAAVAEGADGRLYGCNAITDALYEWTTDGQEQRRVALAPGARYTDLEVVRGSLVCAGVDETGCSVLDVLDAGTLSLLVRHASTACTLSGADITSGGFGYADGEFFFLPEGGEHAKVYTYVVGSDTSLEALIPNASQ